MKKTIVTIGMIAAVGASAFAQGNIAFKAATTATFVDFSLDGSTRTAVPAGGVMPGFGQVQIAVYYNTSLSAVLSLGADANGLVRPNFTTGGWIEAEVLPSTSFSATVAGAVAATTITLPTAVGGSPVEVEVVAFTGTEQDPTAFSYTGQLFNGTTFGQLGFQNGTASATPPAPPATAILTGSSGYGGFTLVPVPEPSSIAIGGLCAAGLLAFRRRK